MAAGPVESASEVLDRVSRTLAGVEARYGAGPSDVDSWAGAFRAAMADNLFWPSGRILNNCGTSRSELASCFVLPVDDDFAGIFDTLRLAALCHRGGGGTGFDLTPLRERGAAISTSGAAGASGPVSWLHLFNAETEVVQQGGKMRGANLGSLSVRHPDVVEFITAKSRVGDLANFNLSVSVDDAFMAALQDDEWIALVSPAGGRVVRRLRAREIWRRIAECAHATGDPGVLFLDAINRDNPLAAALGPIRTTNPCGEQTLYPFEPSNLGSINLAALAGNGDLDWERFDRTVRLAVRLLDDAIDVAEYPDSRLTDGARSNRRLGLGVMGFADLLVRLGVRYDSGAALEVIDRIGSRLREVAWAESARLAAERGPFPNFGLTGWTTPVRNVAITTIAPTGTISMIAGASSGIEPRFAAVWNKDVLDIGGVTAVDPLLLADVMAARGVPAAAARDMVAATPLADLGLPGDRLVLHRFAHDVSAEWHVRIATRWQRYIDNAVSKTVNLARSATVEDVESALLLSWRSGAKGISVYRQGSRGQDLLTAVGAADPSRQSRGLLAATRPA